MLAISLNKRRLKDILQLEEKWSQKEEAGFKNMMNKKREKYIIKNFRCRVSKNNF